MIQRIQFFLLAVLATTLIACSGGGGGDGGDTASNSQAGQYAITSSITSNTCDLPMNQTFSTTLVVTQNGPYVQIVSGELILNGVANDGGMKLNGSITDPTTVNVQAQFFVRQNLPYLYIHTMHTNGCTIIYTGTATKI